MIKALKGINIKGQTELWEEIELWLVGKGVTPYLLPTQNINCLVPSVNQSLAKEGLIADHIVLNYQEFSGPVARLNFSTSTSRGQTFKYTFSAVSREESWICDPAANTGSATTPPVNKMCKPATSTGSTAPAWGRSYLGLCVIVLLGSTHAMSGAQTCHATQVEVWDCSHPVFTTV